MSPERLLMIVLLASAPVLSGPVYACGLEPGPQGGFSVSYPGAFQVAVAVADARRSGVLPATIADAAPNEMRLRLMLGDLKRLQSRLGNGNAQTEQELTTPFSVVLVGPGLWSRYYPSSEGALAEYHTAGPRDGEVVVLTHHVVLREMLDGSLTASAPSDDG